MSYRIFFYPHYQVGNNSVGGGIVVSKVADGGPASKEDGLKIYDVILKVKYVRFFTTRLLSIKSLSRVFFEMASFS